MPGIITLPTGTSDVMSGLEQAQRINTALRAVATKFSGPTAPTAAQLGLDSLANVEWLDTSTTPQTLKVRDAVDGAWIISGHLDQSGRAFYPAGALMQSRNLLDIGNAEIARSNLGVYSAEQVDAAISEAVSGVSGIDKTARDQIAVTNINLLLHGAVTSGALYQGYQWPLVTDEWAVGSSGYVFLAGSPGYYTQSRVPLIPVMTGYNTPSGTASASSEYNASTPAYKAFDGIVSSAWVSANTVTTGTLSYSFASPQVVTTYSIAAVADGSAPKNWTFQARTSAAAGWVVLDTQVNVSAWTPGVPQYFTIPVPGMYLDYKLVITSNNGFTYAVQINELQMYGGLMDMVLRSPTVTVSTPPSTIDLYFLWQSGGAVLGTDVTVKLSRVAGAAWTTATVDTVVMLPGTYSIVKARADVSSQPAGTSMTALINTYNNNSQRVAIPAIYKE